MRSRAKSPAPSCPLSDGETSPPNKKTAGFDGCARVKDAHTLRGRRKSLSARCQVDVARSKRMISLVSWPTNPAQTHRERPSGEALSEAPPRPERAGGLGSADQS
jgi:hypothetical protein